MGTFTTTRNILDSRDEHFLSDPKDDIMSIEFSSDKILRDVFLNWNVNIAPADEK